MSEIKNTSKIVGVNENPEILEIEKKLYEIRKQSDFKIADLKETINGAKRNKLLSEEQRVEIIAKATKETEEAKAYKEAHKEEVKQLIEQGNKLVTETIKVNYPISAKEEKANRVQIKKEHKENMATLKANHKAEVAKLNSSAEDYKEQLSNLKAMYKSHIFDEKKDFETKIEKSKYAQYANQLDAYNKLYNYGNGHVPFIQKMIHNFRTYTYEFKPKDFLIKNGLYIIILLTFIISFIAAPLMGKGNLLTLGHLSQILEQSSTQIFYALGVAGLILLAGTDLSIGRMVGMGAVVTGVFLHSGPNILEFFGIPAGDFSAWPAFVRVLVALLVTITLTTLFSMIAGFFTAKFKMHPFITTLSTQLLIYGLFFYATKGLPVGTMDGAIKKAIAGKFYIGGFPIFNISLYAILAIIIVWFIWNKTKFGKNMYAVGGNQEAAAVSGISVFWTTMGVFIMAGILYGCGSFLEAFRTNPSVGTGTGFELNAIAACVVGGISFSGGVGKISGAVVGVLIFTGLTYVLSVLGIDTNLQFVLKGLIIMAAVALDSLKYLKKK